jgi:hypothetical protein
MVRVETAEKRLCSDVKLHHTENFSATMAFALIGMRREAPENRLCSDVK